MRPRSVPRLAVERARSDLGALADLLLPADCPGCGAGVPLCGGCRAGLQVAPRQLPVTVGPAAAPVWAVADYGGPTAALVRSWKDGGRRDLGRALSRALAAALHAAWLDGGAPSLALVVPVPSRPANRRHRGADLVAELARRAVGELRRLRLAGPDDLRVCPVLRYRRRVADQAGLGLLERSRNLAGAIEVPERLRPLSSGRCCLVVDDVVTTGASAIESARALGCSGARVLAVAAVAYTPRRAGEPAVEPTRRSSR